jgi:hypothetical protein
MTDQTLFVTAQVRPAVEITSCCTGSSIEIRTNADRVWGILTDFAAYPAWNHSFAYPEKLLEVR